VSECCEELLQAFLYSFKKKKIMPSKGNTSNKEGQEESPFVLQAMQQQFERTDVLFNKMRDHMDRQDAIIVT
jgi:hypothetical protein